MRFVLTLAASFVVLLLAGGALGFAAAEWRDTEWVLIGAVIVACGCELAASEG